MTKQLLIQTSQRHGLGKNLDMTKSIDELLNVFKDNERVLTRHAGVFEWICGTLLI